MTIAPASRAAPVEMALADSTPAPREQSRARYPDRTGFVERDGVRSFYEVYGEGEPTVLLMPTWSIIHSRHWKLQIPYLARHSRVLTFDGRGNGRSDRPTDPEAYREEEFVADALAVMDATATERAVPRLAVEGRRTVAAPRGRSPRAGRGHRLHRAGPPGPLLRSPGEGERGVPAAARHIPRLGEVQPPLLGRALRGLPRVLLRAMPQRAALDETARGHRRMGSRHGRSDARRHPAGAPSPDRGGRPGAARPASTVRSS